MSIAFAALFAAFLAWGAARAFSGYSGARSSSGDEPLGLLHAREAALIDAVGEVMFPADGAVPFSWREAGIVSYLDRLLQALDATKRLQIRLLFAFFEHATLFFPGSGIGGFRRFSAQDVAAREAILEGWWSSSLAVRRLMFQALRSVMTLAYLGSPSVLRHLQLAPSDLESPVVEADWLYPPAGKGPEDIPFTPEDRTEPSAGVPLEIGGPIHPAYRDEPPVGGGAA